MNEFKGGILRTVKDVSQKYERERILMEENFTKQKQKIIQVIFFLLYVHIYYFLSCGHQVG